MTTIQYFTNLDWFQFHGKRYVTEQLYQEGFYEIKISRKMNLEQGESLIRITGLCLSVEDGAVYGSISIYKDRIEHDGSFASLKIAEAIEDNQHVYCYKSKKKNKEEYVYKTKGMTF